MWFGLLIFVFVCSNPELTEEEQGKCLVGDGGSVRSSLGFDSGEGGMMN